MTLPKPFHSSRSPPAAAGSEKPTIIRFGPSEIVLHWSLVLPYLTLAVSGILLLARKNIDLPWASRELLKDLHLYAGSLLIALPSLVLMGTRPDPYLRNLRDALRWHWKDLWWLHASPLRLLLPRLKLPPTGRFNPGQKLNLLHVILLFPALVLTGWMLWFGGAAVLLLRIVHVGLAAVSLLFAAGHMYLALIHPSTRTAIGAMFHGRVSADYARSHHPLWHQSVTGRPHAESAPMGRRISLLGFSLLAGLLTMVLVGARPEREAILPDSLRPYLAEPRTALSPGPLHPLHARVPELASCGGCHAPYGGVSSESCLECHEEVARRLAMASGFHGKLQGDCSGCHPDHGPRLITMDDREFNHDLALFRLEGAHRDLDCDQCHERDGAGETATRRYLDIAHDDCGDCHADPHDPPLEPACAHCHRQDIWNDLQAAFAHDRDTSFTLDTAHRSVDCSGCHRRESEQGLPRLTGTPRVCQECHEDVVAAFGGSWADGAAASPSPHYREVECAECHRAGSREEIARCRDCHPADYDRLFVDWQARVELELLGVGDASEAARWRRRGKHHWEAVVDRLRRRHGR